MGHSFLSIHYAVSRNLGNTSLNLYTQLLDTMLTSIQYSLSATVKIHWLRNNLGFKDAFATIFDWKMAESKMAAQPSFNQRVILSFTSQHFKYIHIIYPQVTNLYQKILFCFRRLFSNIYSQGHSYPINFADYCSRESRSHFKINSMVVIL